MSMWDAASRRALDHGFFLFVMMFSLASIIAASDAADSDRPNIIDILTNNLVL